MFLLPRMKVNSKTYFCNQNYFSLLSIFHELSNNKLCTINLCNSYANFFMSFFSFCDIIKSHLGKHMNVWRVDYKLAQNNSLKRLVFSLYQLGRLFLLLKHLIYVGVHIVVVVETFFSIWASTSSYGNREPLYTHVYLILFF